MNPWLYPFSFLRDLPQVWITSLPTKVSWLDRHRKNKMQTPSHILRTPHDSSLTISSSAVPAIHRALASFTFFCSSKLSSSFPSQARSTHCFFLSIGLPSYGPFLPIICLSTAVKTSGRPSLVTVINITPHPSHCHWTLVYLRHDSHLVLCFMSIAVSKM